MLGSDYQYDFGRLQRTDADAHTDSPHESDGDANAAERGDRHANPSERLGSYSYPVELGVQRSKGGYNEPIAIGHV